MATSQQRGLSLDWATVSQIQQRACAELWSQVWPASDGSGIDERLDRMTTKYRPLKGHQLHVAIEVPIKVSTEIGEESLQASGLGSNDEPEFPFGAGRLMAVGRTFLHTIGLGQSSVEIVALASVCSRPDRRGEGWGDLVVRSAFARSEAEGRPVLFQSPAPSFYERFGSRVIDNPITTSLADGDVFNEPWVMVHPGDTYWDKDEVIDLRSTAW